MIISTMIIMRIFLLLICAAGSLCSMKSKHNICTFPPTQTLTHTKNTEKMSMTHKKEHKVKTRQTTTKTHIAARTYTFKKECVRACVCVIV